MVVVLVAASSWWTGLSRHRTSSSTTYPVDAVAWLDQEGLLTPRPGGSTPDTVGNYLELVLGDRASVFVDDRVDMFPVDVVEDEVALVRGSPRWSEVLRRAGTRTSCSGIVPPR